MRILFVTAPPLDRALGGAKPAIELGEEFTRLGWETELLSLGQSQPGDQGATRKARAEYLRALIRSRGSEYDVIDFDHEYLPFARDEFPSDTLLVARSVLLCHQVASRKFPRPVSARGVVGALLWGCRRRSDRREMAGYARRSIETADFINVSNDDDAELLLREGVQPQKVMVFPYGLSEARLALFTSRPADRAHDGVVAFVGTFDWRKGAADLPKIVEQVVREVGRTRFRLLGTRGMFSTAEDVLRRFPRDVRQAIEIVPSYLPDELPRLLEDCALGIFPSYLEGFPFAVLEMLAAALPVVAYDAPGANMMLDRGSVVPIGGRDELAERVSRLLTDPRALDRARINARSRAVQFRWAEIAARTAQAYSARLAASPAEAQGPDRLEQDSSPAQAEA